MRISYFMPIKCCESSVYSACTLLTFFSYSYTCWTARLMIQTISYDALSNTYTHWVLIRNKLACGVIISRTPVFINRRLPSCVTSNIIIISSNVQWRHAITEVQILWSSIFIRWLVYSWVSNEHQSPFKLHREEPKTNQYRFLKNVLHSSVLYNRYE